MNEEKRKRNLAKYGVAEITSEWMDKNYPFAEQVKIFRAAYQIRRTLPRSAKWLSSGNWIRFVLSINRTCRVEAFHEVAQHFDDKMYWRLLGHIFWASRNHAMYRDLYLSLMRAPRPQHHCFHTAEQQYGWDHLPERVLIFRGHGPNNKHGLWYTLQLTTACAAAFDHGKEGRVAGHTVSKHDLFYGGGHQEAVFFVQGLGDIQGSYVSPAESSLALPFAPARTFAPLAHNASVRYPPSGDA